MHLPFNAIHPRTVLRVNGKRSLLIGLCVGDTVALYWMLIQKGSLFADLRRYLEEMIPFLKGRRLAQRLSFY